MSVPVRRFENFASVDCMEGFLERCGYWVRKEVSRYRVKKLGSRGPGKLMTKSSVVDLLDRERVARGLEPIRNIHVKHSKLKVTHG
jgi:hypothetical protein